MGTRGRETLDMGGQVWHYEPEQMTEGGVIARRFRGELAELPGIIIKGEILMG